jgi:membrane protein
VEHGIVQRLRARLARTRERHEWIGHLARAGERYFAQRGNHFAAAITFFSILTAVPLLMVVFAAASYVLWFNPALLAELEDAIAASVPSGLSEAVNPILETAIDQRNSIGTIGLAGALYSGVWWMSNLREAVSAQWELPAPHPAALQRLLYDLRALAGLGAALVVTLSFTVLGTGLAEVVLELLGAPDDGRTRALLRLVGIVLGVGANWLIFAWAITRLPRTDVALRGVRRAALLGAIGFEVLKQFVAVYFDAVTSTPGGAVFGSLLGLLLFGYLVARLLLWVTAWAATVRGNERVAPVPVPGAVVLRQEVVVSRDPSAGGLGAALLLGVVTGAWLRGRGR